MEKFKLPKKWCIRQNTDQIVCDWFNKKFNLNAALNGSFKYVNSDGWYCEEKGRYEYSDYTEITFEQFKQYVLNEKPELINYTKLINMLKYIDERNRTLT